MALSIGGLTPRTPPLEARLKLACARRAPSVCLSADPAPRWRYWIHCSAVEGALTKSVHQSGTHQSAGYRLNDDGRPGRWSALASTAHLPLWGPWPGELGMWRLDLGANRPPHRTDHQPVQELRLARSSASSAALAARRNRLVARSSNSVPGRVGRPSWRR